LVEKFPMKKILLLLCAAGVMAGCEDRKRDGEAAPDSADGAEAAKPTEPVAGSPSEKPVVSSAQAGGFEDIAAGQGNGYQSQEVLLMLLREVERNPEEAASWAATLPPGVNRDACLEAVFSEWAGIDAEAAVDFARRKLSGMDLTVAAASIGAVLATDSPEAASMALSLVAEPIARGVVVESIASGAVSVDPQRASQWALALRDPVERRAALQSLVDAWSSTDLRSAAAWVDSALQGPEKSEAVEVLITNWASIDPRSAVEWLSARRGQVDFDGSGKILAESWAVVDPKAASQWAMAETGAAREDFVEAVMQSWALNETSNAIAWASAIGDPEIRGKALAAGFESIREDSPAALEAWIQANPGHPAMEVAVEAREETPGE
jgi:hypothetical protein